ncbi:4-aminobutyrate--2-oxoglutarate transaminase [Sulfitobacter sp. SK012]|uniref:4-aminobutyrate--2-oxoglutarate transaminase n=1 Tax=Sulfitobacter sp. SK012 TaxID=1389005 RepID=UPI000E0B3B18|nr:4-aminobutyrate--2-oxoglutarate transaminase [Sulfitobacter sp. SK012]AXI47963.1 4-aminobutyrate--2-oxoglutarate transaminase [Sulfitobacter sp. SK012]
MSNQEFEARRDKAVARAIAFSSTFVADRAENAEVWDVEGNRYIDFCGGIGCQNVGHRNAEVVAAIKDQLDQLTHTCFQVTPYKSYIELAERLNALLPGDFPKKSLFFSAGGEAVENAIKIARYFTRRPALITFTNGYHGRSYMGMALSARMVPFKEGFGPFPGEIYRLPFPDEFHGVTLEDTKRAFETLFRSDCPPDQIAAMFFEPVQGEGGYNIATPEFLNYLRALCDEHGIVLVADEIQTGMGRTGRMFAMEHFGITPDLTCIGKSIGGGLPISGVVGRADIIDSVPPGGLGGTFGGNPVACAAALAVLEVIEQDNLLQRGLDMGNQIDTRLRKMAQRNSFDCIGDVRALGCMNAIEIVTDRSSRAPNGDLTVKIVDRALKNGLILLTAGPQRNVIRLLVPLSAAPSLVDEGLDILEKSIEEALV